MDGETVFGGSAGILAGRRTSWNWKTSALSRFTLFRRAFRGRGSIRLYAPCVSSTASRLARRSSRSALQRPRPGTISICYRTAAALETLLAFAEFVVGFDLFDLFGSGRACLLRGAL
jgi:hypothetical protein